MKKGGEKCDINEGLWLTNFSKCQRSGFFLRCELELLPCATNVIWGKSRQGIAGKGVTQVGGWVSTFVQFT